MRCGLGQTRGKKTEKEEEIKRSFKDRTQRSRNKHTPQGRTLGKNYSSEITQGQFRWSIRFPANLTRVAQSVQIAGAQKQGRRSLELKRKFAGSAVPANCVFAGIKS